MPRLHAVLDVEAATHAGWSVPDLAEAFLSGGARFIQLRGKGLSSVRLLQYADLLVPRARAFGATMIVNDRADVARLSGAAGVHVGQEDLSPAAARDLLGPAAVIGFSTHTFAQVRAAAREPVSYVAVGPVYGTRTKNTGYEAVGLDLVAEAARISHALPVVAIGGITLERAPAVIEAGAAAVAVISDLLLAGDPAARVAAYVRALGG